MNKYMEYGSAYRSFGCRITEYVLNGIKCVTLENSLLRVSIAAGKGTDIFEFRYKPEDVDYMWHSPFGLRCPGKSQPSIQSEGGSFLDYYEGGWQELFPNIGDATYCRGAHLGIHGEVFMLPWSYEIKKDTVNEIEIKFCVRTYNTPFYLEKTLTLKENIPILYMHETVVNEGNTEFEFMWGHHPALGYPFIDGEVFIDIPAARGRTFNRSLHPVLPVDKEFAWPEVTNDSGYKCNFCRLPFTDEKWAGICYAHELEEGWYAVTNPKKGLGFGMVWDKELYPYVWIWMVYGGFKDYPWYGRGNTIALEPWSSVPDKLEKAALAGTLLKLKSHETISTDIKAVVYKAKGHVTRITEDGEVECPGTTRQAEL